MRLTTIWTLRGMTLRERLNRTGEAFIRAVAHRLPQRLAYWVLIDQGVRHIADHEVVTDVPFMDVLGRAG